VFRVTFDPRITTWERLATPGGRVALGGGPAFTGDSAVAWYPSVARLQQDVRAVTGLAGFVATLGRDLLAIRAERRVTPIGVEYGVTDRLSVGVMVPVVRVNVREGFQQRPPGSNLGLLPQSAADVARYSRFFTDLDAALAELGDSVAAGGYDCPGGPVCLRAQALQAQGQAFRDALHRAVYDSTTTDLFLPLEDSDAGRGIAAIEESMRRALADTFGITPFSRDTFLLPAFPAPASVADSILAERMTAAGFGPYGLPTLRRLRYFPGDAEVTATYRLRASGNFLAAATVLVRLPTGHQESPNNPFDISTGDHQTDVEARLTQEVTLLRRLWLNLSVRGGRQLAGERDRRVGPAFQPFLPSGALTRLNWDPGDYFAVDVAPLYRVSGTFALGVTAGYYTQGRDRYTFRTPQDSSDLATRLGAPISASVLDAGTAERRTRLGVALTYVGPDAEGGLSIEQTVSAAGGLVPVTTVFRIVMRASRWPF
jgi:hypothetical protein